jgi:hypothetical protein
LEQQQWNGKEGRRTRKKKKTFRMRESVAAAAAATVQQQCSSQRHGDDRCAADQIIRLFASFISASFHSSSVRHSLKVYIRHSFIT